MELFDQGRGAGLDLGCYRSIASRGQTAVFTLLRLFLRFVRDRRDHLNAGCDDKKGRWGHTRATDGGAGTTGKFG